MELVTERLTETGPLFNEFYKWEAFPPTFFKQNKMPSMGVHCELHAYGMHTRSND